MKKIISLVITFLLVFSLCQAGFAEELPQSIDLKLVANPSTGYSWQSSSSDEAVAYAEEIGFQQLSDAAGAPGVSSLKIHGGKEGTADIRFFYARSWESVQPALEFTVSVTVDAQGNVTMIPRMVLSAPEEGAQWEGTPHDPAIVRVTQEDSVTFALEGLQDGADQSLLFCIGADGSILHAFAIDCEIAGGALSIRTLWYLPGDLFSSSTFSFSTTDLDGNTVTDAVFAEHTLTVLNFWEPWCGPCVAEMPYLQQLSQEYAEKGVLVLGIYSTPDSEEDVMTVLEQSGVTYPILHYVSAFDSFQTGYVPTTVIVDSAGNIVYGPTSGAMNFGGWSELIEGLL